MRISDWSSDVCSSDLNFCLEACFAIGTAQVDFGLIAGLQPMHGAACRRPQGRPRSEERREGKSVSVRVDLGGRRIIKKKKIIISTRQTHSTTTNTLTNNT